MEQEQQQNKCREIFEELCKRLVGQLKWRYYEDFVCVDSSDTGTEDQESDTAFTLHYEEKEARIWLKLYEGSEHLTSVRWTGTQRIWVNEITQQTLIRGCECALENIYKELAEKTATI